MSAEPRIVPAVILRPEDGTPCTDLVAEHREALAEEQRHRPTRGTDPRDDLPEPKREPVRTIPARDEDFHSPSMG